MLRWIIYGKIMQYLHAHHSCIFINIYFDILYSSTLDDLFLSSGINHLSIYRGISQIKAQERYLSLIRGSTIRH